MLRRAFSNLLSNAIKYSPDNTCTAIHIERDSDCVNVMITNTMSGQFPLIWNVCLTGSIAQTHQGSTTRKARAGIINYKVDHSCSRRRAVSSRGGNCVQCASVNGLIPLFRRNPEGDKNVIVQSRDKQRRFYNQP